MRRFFWERWLREYYVTRVIVDVTLTRILAWPALDAAGEPHAVHGEPLPPAPAAPQRPPKNGTGPRIDVTRAAKRLRRTTYTLLVYTGADGMPVVVASRSAPTTSVASSSRARAPCRRVVAGPASSVTATDRSSSGSTRAGTPAG